MRIVLGVPDGSGGVTDHFPLSAGWSTLRDEDLGLLWEHFVLNEIQGRLQYRAPRYWRNKQGAEVDFVIPRRGEAGPIAIECKWKSAAFEPNALAAFRHIYPKGENYIVTADTDTPHSRRFKTFKADFVPLDDLIARLSAEPLSP